MNQITITGNVGSEPELKMIKDTTLAEFAFAHTPYTKSKGEGETIWFTVTFWNSKADGVMDAVRKGDRLILVGELTESRWEKDGVQKSRLGITGVSFGHIAKPPKNPAPYVASVHEDTVAPW